MSAIFGFSVSGQSNDPAAASGYIGDSQDFWDNTPVLVLSPESQATTLPTEVNNSDYFYFPYKDYSGEIKKHIYLQEGNASCAAVSTVFYTFSYEINRARGVPGLFDENKYPPNFTWNFLNDGIYDKGSGFYGNLLIVKENGVPNSVDWGNLDPADYLRWMSGYEKYHNSHYNRIEGYSKIHTLYNPDSLMLLKHWIADHNKGSAIGGLAVFAAFGACADEVYLPPESAHAGEEATVEWGTDCEHAMTIVGYCDDIKWDYNGDGQFTNYIDLNEDNIIDVRDWETGAFNIVGQGNENYAQDGFVWIMYKTVAEAQMHLIGTLVPSQFLVLHVNESYEPQLEVKAKIQYDNRNAFGSKISWSENADDYVFTNQNNAHAYIQKFFFFNGGDLPLHGIDYEPVEMLFDFSYWFLEENFGKIFYRCKEIDPENNYNGFMEYFSIIDYRWGEEFELYCEETNVPINNNIWLTNIYVDYDLIPHETDIEEDLLLFSDMVSRFNPTVVNGATLTVEDGVQIDMYNSNININSGSSLVLEDNVTIIAKRGICKLIVDGNVSIGNGVSFLAEGDAQLQIEINNTTTALEVTLNNAHFNGAGLIAKNDKTTITNSDFTDRGIWGFNGDFDISNTEFISSFVNISNADGNDRYVYITENCNFSGMQSTTAIYIDNYPNFKIDECSITECSSAINLFNCGYGTKHAQISNSTVTENSASGITVYLSSVDILHNEIVNNSYGIKCFDRSVVHIEGDNLSVTQEIKDNDSYEVFATRGSFPHYFHWNLVQDDDNLPGDPLVKYTGQEEGLDVRNNCWGNNFDPENDLDPYESYLWEPVWECMSGSGSGEGSEAEGMYLAARDKIEAEDFAGAKADFQEIVVQYPTTKYAQASLKELYSIEAFVTNDYPELKTYYSSEPNITNNPELAKLADFLINFCEIKLQNWPTAIAWFEDVIQNPESLEDSIFAIIDLGYTYFLMENGGFKSAYVGNMAQYKPVSRKQFEEDRDYLLSLLPGDELSKSMKESLGQLKSGELLQNIPNPFKGSTQIYYKLEEAAAVNIRVYNYSGQLVKSYNEGVKTGGVHYVEFDANGMSHGIYFYSIKVNGKTSDSKKMSVVR